MNSNLQLQSEKFIAAVIPRAILIRQTVYYHFFIKKIFFFFCCYFSSSFINFHINHPVFISHSTVTLKKKIFFFLFFLVVALRRKTVYEEWGLRSGKKIVDWLYRHRFNTVLGFKNLNFLLLSSSTLLIITVVVIKHSVVVAIIMA